MSTLPGFSVHVSVLRTVIEVEMLLVATRSTCLGKEESASLSGILMEA